MKRLAINKEINIKWLTRQLQAAGVNVVGVGQDESGAYAEIAEADEATALAVIEAHDPDSTPDILERADLVALADDITNQVDWIGVTIPEIDNGLGAVDTAFSNATQRAIIRGLLQNQRRTLLIIRGILKAFRFVVRQLIR